VSKFIKKNLGSETLPAIVDACPLPDQLQLCWPRKRVYDRAIVYAGIPGGLEHLASLGYELAPPLAGDTAILAPPESMALVMDILASVPIPLLASHHPDGRSSTDAPPGHAVAPPAPAAALVPTASDVPTRRLRTKTSFDQGG
jgi:hypothetical protein